MQLRADSLVVRGGPCSPEQLADNAMGNLDEEPWGVSAFATFDLDLLNLLKLLDGLIPHKKIRYTTVQQLTAAGFPVVQSPLENVPVPAGNYHVTIVIPANPGQAEPYFERLSALFPHSEEHPRREGPTWKE